MKITILLALLFCIFAIAFANERNEEEAPAENETNLWVVQVKKGIDANKVAKGYGYKNLGNVGTLEDFFLFEKLATREEKPELSTCPDVVLQERQVERKRYKRPIKERGVSKKSSKRLTINDPLYSSQWHLQSTGVGLTVVPVWDRGVIGEGITVAVVDDGLEPNNRDIGQNYRADTSYDFNGNDPDPNPNTQDEHGTSSAGCVAAAPNAFCGVGVAPGAKVSGIRLIAAATVDATEARALSYKIQDNDIFTSSWGPFDDGNRYEGPGPALKAAFEQSVRTGRDGKGTIYMWAGGNGRRNGDNCNYDGYVNSRFTIGIGAVADSGTAAWYSEPCSALFASAPSSGGAKRVVTSDLNGSRGASSGDCNSGFGGTSAASPIAAGVVALMLSANPNLTWRDVQHIIANSSKIVDAGNPDWWTNAGGYHHNHDYGFGLLDPVAAVNQATSWRTVPTYVSYTTTKTVSQAIPSGRDLIVSFTINDSQIRFVEHIEILVRATHPRKGSLSIQLSNAFGTRSVLSVQHGDNSAFPGQGWTFGSVRHWGEAVNQNWEFRIQDTRGGTGTLQSVQLNFYGH